MRFMTLLIVFGLCLGVVWMGCGGGGGGGGSDDGNTTPEAAAEAERIAGDLIASDYPELEQVTPEYQAYEAGGHQIHEFSYLSMREVQSDGETITIPHNVIVSVDEASGATEVYVSN